MAYKQTPPYSPVPNATIPSQLHCSHCQQQLSLPSATQAQPEFAGCSITNSAITANNQKQSIIRRVTTCGDIPPLLSKQLNLETFNRADPESNKPKKIKDLRENIIKLQHEANILRRVYPEYAAHIHFFADHSIIINTETSIADLFRYASSAYITMPEFPGITLDHYIERHKHDPENFFKGFQAVINAILQLHAIGIAHQDIDATNFLIDTDPGHPLTARIIDFADSEEPASTKAQILDFAYWFTILHRVCCDPDTSSQPHIHITTIYNLEFEPLRKQLTNSPHEVPRNFNATMQQAFESAFARLKQLEARQQQLQQSKSTDALTSRLKDYETRCLSWCGLFTRKITRNKYSGANALMKLVATDDTAAEQVVLSKAAYQATFNDHCFSFLALFCLCQPKLSRLATLAVMLEQSKLIKVTKNANDTYTVARDYPKAGG